MQDYLNVRIRQDQLHANLGDGLPTGSLILVEGKDGAGKSIIAQRFSYSILESKKKVTYITTELSTKDFIDQMSSIKYYVDEHIINQNLLVIPMFPFMGGVKLRDDFIDRLMAAEQLFDSDFIVIDAFSFLLVQPNMTEGKSFDVINFFKKMTNKNRTILLTVDPEHLNASLLTLLRSVSDIYLELGSKTLAGEERKFIRINRFKKSRGTISNQIAFRVDPGVGFIVEIAALA
ncbi:MAG: ATPase [Candidatus Altiarchaeales archaeon]|nr:ATPase [Candidatus Altiarchaeales archaeon]